MYITRRRNWGARWKSAFPDLAERVPLEIKSFKAYLFVPQGIEPGRLYVNTVVDAGNPTSTRRYYSPGPIERRIQELVSERLDSEGHPIPRSPIRRQGLAVRLSGTPSECATREIPLLAGVGSVTNPVLIAGTKRDPDYPGAAQRGRRTDRVILRAIINEDGWVGDVRQLRGGKHGQEFYVPAAHAVTFWRYRPALLDDCPVSVYFTVFIEFRLR